MYNSFADLLKAHKSTVAAEVPEAKPVPVVLENLSVVDGEGRQCCPGCGQPFLGLGPACYSC